MALFDWLQARVAAAFRRARRLERRELAAFGRWIEDTSNLVHLSVLFFVPVLIAVVTWLSNAVELVSFLLFPPLASGTYTLFSNPEGQYSSPRKFVAGMTLGALSGWLALEVTARYWYHVPPEQFAVHAGAAALGIFLTGAFSWALDLEQPSAFSTALLVLLIGGNEFVYVVGVAVSSAVVAGAFYVWYDEFYEHRAEYLYGTLHSDDHVLVPMRTDAAEETAMFGAHLAAAHDAGKVVLLDVVDSAGLAASADAEHSAVEGDEYVSDGGRALDDFVTVEDEVTRRAVLRAASRLESHASRIRREFGVPVEVVVAGGDPVAATITVAQSTNSDLIVAPFEAHDASFTGYVQSLFDSAFDVVVFRSVSGRTSWRRVLVMIARVGDTAHAMVDFATRLARSGGDGEVSTCSCIQREVERRPAETRLADVVDAFEGQIETRVSRSDVKAFIDANANAYDLVVIGSSQDRSKASRFLSRPTAERLWSVDCDVAIVDRGTV